VLDHGHTLSVGNKRSELKPRIDCSKLTGMNISTTWQRNLKKLSRMKQQAVKGLMQTLKHIDAERKKRTADLDEAARAVLAELQQWGHKADGSSKPKAKKAATTGGAKRRVRRTPEQLKDEATKILAFVRSAGKDGVGGGEIRKKFPGVGQNIKDFVQKNTGAKLKTTGQKVKMRYFG
jgi:hypothetical protein